MGKLAMGPRLCLYLAVMRERSDLPNGAKRRLSPMTAEEFLEWSKSQPVSKEKAARQKVWAETARLSELAQRDLVQDLNSVGANINAVSDLLERRDYPECLPILAKHLLLVDYAPIKEMVARAMATEEAEPYLDLLLEQYYADSRDRVRDGLAIALSFQYRALGLDRLCAFALDRSLGASRIFFLKGISRLGGPKALQVLQELSSDSEVKFEAIEVLKKVKA